MTEEAIVSDVAVLDQWGQVCDQLKTEIGETAFDSWLKPLTIGSFNNGTMNICVPTRFMRNWVITNYSDRIQKFGKRKIQTLKV